MFITTFSVIVSVLTVVEAGDACCKAEAARRALIADPFAVKPTNWDDEDDGLWEAPKVAMTDLPAWYRFLHETRLGLMGAAPWLIVGVVAAALLTTVLKPLFPSSMLHSWLGSNNANKNATSSNAIVDSIRGSMFGLLVPFCSCGALPLALALKQEGVSSSSIAAFVTAAQAAGVDSLFFTYGVFGARTALLRLAAAGVLAFSVGMILAETNNNTNKEDSSKKSKEQKISDEGSCCDDNDDKSNGGCHEKSNTKTTITSMAAFTLFVNTAVELFSSVAVWVFLGVVVSASASVWAPPTSAAASAPASSITFSSADVDIFLVMKSVASRAGLFLLTLPMTICEHGIVSLADALRGVGFSAGTAVALVVTGPSTNAGTLLLLSRLNNDSNNNQNWIFDGMKITAVILIFGVSLSYLADDLGSTIMMTKAETATSSGGSALPEWLNQNAVSLAAVFTIASVIQSSSWLFGSSSSQSSPSSCTS